MTRPKSNFPHAGLLAALAGLCLFAVLPTPCAGDEPDHEPTARELYNNGTQELTNGKLAEAEASLQGAVATQDERVQPAALYNLGLTRFQQGIKELTNAPDRGALEAQSSFAGQSGASALHAIDDSLASQDVDAMVAAYQRGRGARRDLKGAIAAVKHAMDTFGIVLTKWRRASGDFHSTIELNHTDQDARTNADLTDQYIAKLVDLQQMMMMRMAALEKQLQELRKKMAMMKGKIPDQTGTPMAGDDGDDDDDGTKPPRQPQAGDTEGPVKDGREIQWTQEEARQLLNLLQLDSGRKLYLGGFEDGPKPRDPKARDW